MMMTGFKGWNWIQKQVERKWLAQTSQPCLWFTSSLPQTQKLWQTRWKRGFLILQFCKKKIIISHPKAPTIRWLGFKCLIFLGGGPVNNGLYHVTSPENIWITELYSDLKALASQAKTWIILCIIWHHLKTQTFAL